MAIQSVPEVGTTGNLFLDSLPAASAEPIVSLLERIETTSGMPIARAGEPIEHILFPIGSVISAVARMRDGSDVEVSLVGREGFFGIQVVLGNGVTVTEAMVQIPNSMYRLRSADFERCLNDDDVLRERALRYVQACIDTVGQFAACNRLHPIDERCSRWLLMAHDRVVGDEILLTHEFLAMMLGVRRPGVSIAAAALESAGLIEYHRGRIVVKNRAGLERAACECYGFANDTLDPLLAYNVRKR